MNNIGFNKTEVTDKAIKAITKWLKLPHYKIFYFGSRIGGKATERSDLDVGIEAESVIPGDILADIKDELANIPILQKIDLVDFRQVSDDFKSVALQNIEVIYEK